MDSEVWKLLCGQFPTDKELQEQARSYLASLTSEEKERLRAEELSGPSELRFYKFQLLRKAGFTDLEARVYSYRPFDREVIAYRALAVEMGVIEGELSFYEARRLEAEVLEGLSGSEVIERLKAYGCTRESQARDKV